MNKVALSRPFGIKGTQRRQVSNSHHGVFSRAPGPYFDRFGAWGGWLPGGSQPNRAQEMAFARTIAEKHCDWTYMWVNCRNPWRLSEVQVFG